MGNQEEVESVPIVIEQPTEYENNDEIPEGQLIPTTHEEEIYPRPFEYVNIPESYFKVYEEPKPKSEPEQVIEEEPQEKIRVTVEDYDPLKHSGLPMIRTQYVPTVQTVPATSYYPNQVGLEPLRVA
jgi:hypothetical protein